MVKPRGCGPVKRRGYCFLSGTVKVPVTRPPVPPAIFAFILWNIAVSNCSAVVQFTEIVMNRQSPRLYRVLGIYLPLITTNCAVLGVALLNVQARHSLLESVLYGFGAALGFGLVLVLFSAMRERLEAADVPASWRGTPHALVTAGLMSLAFMGFSGMVAA